jgi:hypothetical protein
VFSTHFDAGYFADLSHFEESHSGEKGVTACLMLWPDPFQLQLICYFLQSTLQVLAAFHKILQENYHKLLTKYEDMT